MNQNTRTRQSLDLTNGLPADPDAEKFLLGYLLVDSAGRHLPNVCAGLHPSDFCLAAHETIFRRICDLAERNEPVDRITLANELQRHHKELERIGGLSYLASLDDGMPVNLTSAYVEGYIRRIKETAIRRRFALAANDLLKRAVDTDEPTENLLIAAAKSFTDLQADGRQEEPPVAPSWPEPLHEDAFHGVAGELVRVIEPHTEADPAALLLQLLAAWGSLIGRGPFYLVESDCHHTNLYVVIVGATSKGRKGTSWGRIRRVLADVDEHWTDHCIIRGLGSGEGLIDAMDGENADKRCLVQEAELARILAIVSREGTTLSAVIRDAYDTGSLSITTRQHKVNIKGAHVSLIAHISRDELRRRLNDTEIANGFANRKLWTCAARSRELPEGGKNLDQDLAPIIKRLSDATEFARKMGNTRVRMDEAARVLWRDVYHDLSAARPGLLGDVTNRMEANTIRVSLIYALLDHSEEIGEVHLRAALAVVAKYCYQSAKFIWGDSLGDPIADAILRVLRMAATEGLTRWDLMNHFGRNRSAGEIDRGIGVLAEHSLIRHASQESGGRPITRYWAL
jgi:hypothetical protein